MKVCVHHVVISSSLTSAFSGPIEPEGTHKCILVRCVSDIKDRFFCFTSAQSIAKCPHKKSFSVTLCPAVVVSRQSEGAF